MLLKTLLLPKKNAKPLALPTRPCALKVLGELMALSYSTLSLIMASTTVSLCTLAVSTASLLVCSVSVEFSVLSPLSPLPG